MARTARGDGERRLKRRSDPLIELGVTTVDDKVVVLLRRFVSDRGKIRSRRVTGLTGQQQRQVAAAIKTAREMALLPGAPKGR